MFFVRSLRLSVCVFFVCLIGGQAVADEEPGSRLTIFAAASLKNVLDKVSKEFSGPGADIKRTKIEVTLAYAGTNALARQIEQGAPADLIIAADRLWIDYLLKQKLIRPDVQTIASNRLVLIAAADHKFVPFSFGNGPPLASLLSSSKGTRDRLALANTGAVPAGRYAKAALQHFNQWDALNSHLAEASNVRVALAYVARGEAPLGIVYASDAAAETKVKILGTIPAKSHPKILYQAAIVSRSNNAAAKVFVKFLLLPDTQKLFTQTGFVSLQKAEQ